MPRDIKKNKGNFSEKFPFSVFPDQLEQNSEVFGVFQQTTYTVYCCKTPKFESCYTIFCSKNAESWVILFKKMEFFFKKNQKKCKKNKKNIFFSFTTPHYHLTLRSVRKKNFEKFSEPVLYEFSQIWANFQILFGTTVTKTVTVTVTSPMKILPWNLKRV